MDGIVAQGVSYKRSQIGEIHDDLVAIACANSLDLDYSQHIIATALGITLNSTNNDKNLIIKCLDCC